MTSNEVYALAKQFAPARNFDPLLITALCEQESSYSTTAIRLENGFLRKYLLKTSHHPIVKALFATSFGLTQMMGQSLREVGYITNPSDLNGTIAQIATYIDSPAFQVDWGIRWLDIKRKHAGDDPSQYLLAWNGGSDDTYDDKVLDRMERLKKELL